MTSSARSTYSEIERELDALSVMSGSSSDIDEIPILDREDEDFDLAMLPALSSSVSLSSNSSCFSFPSRSPHTGARWYDDHDFNPLSATSSISFPSTDFPAVSSESLHDALLDTCTPYCSDITHNHSMRSRSGSDASFSTSALPPNPPPSLCGFPLDGMKNDDATSTRLAISEATFQKLQIRSWEAIGNGESSTNTGSPERKKRLLRVRKAGGAVHKKLEKAMGEIFRR